MEISRYTRPKTLDEAYTLIRENGGFPLGGGAWVHMNVRKGDLAVDLCALDLRYIAERGDTIEIGAMATARDLEISPLLKDVFGELFRNATEHLVGVQLRNVITIGGTVAGKYGFSDIITVLAALDASLVMYKDEPVDIVSFLTTARDAPYLLEKIVVDKNVRASFQSVRVTKNDFAILNACAARAGDAWRIAVGGGGPPPPPPPPRLELKRALRAIEYQPAADEAGTIKDLSSDGRLNLIIEMQTKFAQSYGYWQQGQDPTVLDQWPAQELFRAESREVPRDWLARWDSARAQVGSARTATDSRAGMVAVKNDPIWTAISAFGVPYPPFDYNSGMDVQDVDRERAISLGVIDRDTRVAPQQRPFNEKLAMTADDRQADLFRTLLETLGPGVEFAGGELRLRG